MGCCFSDQNSEHHEESDVNERTQLLHDPVSASGNAATSYNTTSSVSSQPKGDEQSALSRILHQTSNNIIDVGALNTHNIEQHEYFDRARIYSVRLSKTVANMKNIPTANSRQFPGGVAAPQAILSQPAISQADIHFIMSTSDQISATVHDIKVKHKVDLVVPFGLS